MNICAVERYKAADRELETTYAAILAGSDPARASLVAASQETWKKFREQGCAVHGDLTRTWGHAVHGTMAGSMHGACMYDVTVRRINELKEIGAMEKPAYESAP
jgi:uncharacterized protein YecT (DUF1311 family)